MVVWRIPGTLAAVYRLSIVWLLIAVKIIEPAKEDKVYIVWSAKNKIFNQTTAIEINAMMTNILHWVCEKEWLSVFQVDLKGFQTCNAVNGTRMLFCEDNVDSSRPSILIRIKAVTMDNGPTFMPGNSYYYIVTSDGTKKGQHMRIGGLCSQSGLRLKLNIQEFSVSEKPKKRQDKKHHKLQPHIESGVNPPSGTTLGPEHGHHGNGSNHRANSGKVHPTVVKPKIRGGDFFVSETNKLKPKHKDKYGYLWPLPVYTPRSYSFNGGASKLPALALFCLAAGFTIL